MPPARRSMTCPPRFLDFGPCRHQLHPNLTENYKSKKKRRCDFSVDNVGSGQNKQRKLEEGIKWYKFMLNLTTLTKNSFQMAARIFFRWIPKLFSNETEEKKILLPKAQRSPEKQTNKCLADFSGDESQSESQSKSKSDDNLDLSRGTSILGEMRNVEKKGLLSSF